MSFRREASAQGQAACLPDSDQVSTLGFGSDVSVCSTCEKCVLQVPSRPSPPT